MKRMFLSNSCKIPWFFLFCVDIQVSVTMVTSVHLHIVGCAATEGDNWFSPQSNLVLFTSEIILWIIDSLLLVICKIIAIAMRFIALSDFWLLFLWVFFLTRKVLILLYMRKREKKKPASCTGTSSHKADISNQFFISTCFLLAFTIASKTVEKSLVSGDNLSKAVTYSKERSVSEQL